jgi:hypothetical protein
VEAVRTDYIRKEGDLFVLDGTFGVIYNVDTIELLDGNLANLRRDHPDIDRLLDARKTIGLVNHIFGGPIATPATPPAP